MTGVLEAIVVPLLVAIVMGGPAWVTARAARKEGLTVAGVLVTRIEAIDDKLDRLVEWKSAHEAEVDAEVAAAKIVEAAGALIAEEQEEAIRRANGARVRRRHDGMTE